MTLTSKKRLIVDSDTQSLYKWSKGFRHIQQNFFNESIKLRREKQILDFILLNEFNNVKFKTDTDVFVDAVKVSSSREADLTVITDQKFSRYPCPVIIQKIKEQLLKCPNLYLCLNKTYINIDNSFHDQTLSENYNLAIIQWLKKSLDRVDIIDLSLDVVEMGNQFTWVIPDRHYFIRKINDKNN
jgi:hypothetical protein